MARDIGEGGASGARQGGEGGAVVHLWLTKTQATKELGVSSRTLLRKVKRGEVERQQVGREARFRILKRATKRATLDTGHAGQLGEGGKGGESHEPVLELTSVIAEPDPLVAQLRELVTRNGQLERERAEAITIGHWLADEKEQLSTDNERLQAENATLNALLREAVEVVAKANDDARRLHSVIDGLVDGVAHVSSDWKAVPVRGRLRAILASI